MRQVKAKVINNVKVSPGHFKMKLWAPLLSREALPGQFLEIRVSEGLEPFLRRPLGVHRASKGYIEVLYEVVGKGTQALSKRKGGELLDLIGPLGIGFKVNKKSVPVLLSGGMGVAPLLFLAEVIAKRGLPGHAAVLLGARNKEGILCEKEFKRLGYDVRISTDDGSAGFKGKATDLLKQLLPITSYQLPVTIYSCGPRPMLAKLCAISRKHNLDTQVSLEEHMGCGTGVCMGCVVETISGFKRVCSDGPVFQAKELVL